MSLLQSFASFDRFLAGRVARPLADRIAAAIGLDCFQLARLASLASICLDATMNLWLLRGHDGTALRTETSLAFLLGIFAAGAIILRSLQLQQERNALSSGTPVNLAFKFGRFLVLAYAGFATACFAGGVGQSLASFVDPTLAAPMPPQAMLRFLTDRLGDASFLFALYCLDLRPRLAGRGKKLAFTASR